MHFPDETSSMSSFASLVKIVSLDVLSFSKAPSYSLSPRLNRIQHRLELPGPAHYVISSSLRTTRYSAPSFSMTSRPRRSKLNAFPGPGQYSVSGASTAPKYSMGTRVKPRRVTFFLEIFEQDLILISLSV